MFVFSHFCVIKLLIVNSLVAVELLRYMLHILIVSVTLGTCLGDKDKANDKVTKAEEQKSDDPSNNATVKEDNSTQVSIKEKSLKQNKSVVSSKTNNNETDRIAKIRQIQKDAFKKETPVKVESKKNEILIKVD